MQLTSELELNEWVVFGWIFCVQLHQLNDTMEEVKIVKIIVAVAVLCAALNCQMVNATGHEHHKIRHFKHKIVHINDQHVNEIREAFEDYKKTVRNSVDKSFLRQLSVDDDLTQDASDYENENEIVYENRSKMLSKLQTTRHKRVDVYESTSKSYTKTDNYDEEYDDEDEKMYDAKTKSSGVKVHVSWLNCDLSSLEKMKLISFRSMSSEWLWTITSLWYGQSCWPKLI